MDISWINIGSFWVSIGASLVAVFAALVGYIVYRSQIDPEIIVYVEDDEKRPTIMNLIIKNVGKGVARNISFYFSEDPPSGAWGLSEKEAKIAPKMEKGPLISGIPFLPPGGKRVLTWGQYGGLMKNLEGKAIMVTANYYSDHFGFPKTIKHKTQCPLEVYSFEATDASDRNYDKKIAENIEKLTKVVQNISRNK